MDASDEGLARTKFQESWPDFPFQRFQSFLKFGSWGCLNWSSGGFLTAYRTDEFYNILRYLFSLPGKEECNSVFLTLRISKTKCAIARAALDTNSDGPANSTQHDSYHLCLVPRYISTTMEPLVLGVMSVTLHFCETGNIWAMIALKGGEMSFTLVIRRFKEGKRNGPFV